MYCKNCGIELEDSMAICPLCGQPAGIDAPVKLTYAYGKKPMPVYAKMSKPQKKLTWEIISIILFSAAVTTFIVDFILNGRITWSEYPTAICLTIFCYVSLFAFWDQSLVVEMAAGFVFSSLCMGILDSFTNGIQWSVKLGMPLLLATSFILIALITIVRRSKYKGLNLVAYFFLATALLCVFIEGAVSYFRTELFKFQWSIIAGACTIPVVFVLLFTHFRLKKGRSLKKTFHV